MCYSKLLINSPSHGDAKSGAKVLLFHIPCKDFSKKIIHFQNICMNYTYYNYTIAIYW